MADNARFTLITEVSENTDYSNPYIKRTFTQTETPDEAWQQTVEANTSGGTTVTTSIFASATALLVHNPSTNANNVTARYSTAATSNVDNVLTPGDTLYTTDFDVSANLLLTAATAAQTVQVVVVGS